MDAQQRLLVERSEEAISDGLDLYRWCFANIEKLPRHRLDLGRRYELANTAEGFFGECAMGGRKESVMGARQDVEFGRIEGRDAAARLREYVLRDLLETGHWTYPDGKPGGFAMSRLVCRPAAGDARVFAPAERAGAVDWRELGPKYRWVLLRVDLHDFIMPMGPFEKKLEEAACVVAHPDFIRVLEKPAPGCDLEVTVGYPFIRFAPIPNFFGFGPGKFHMAIKSFSFFLEPGGNVRARMYFAAAPRCGKVFDFGPSIPDPVYGGADLLGKLGLIDAGKFHDKTDLGMLAQHCRVHQAFMEGAAKIFKARMAG